MNKFLLFPLLTAFFSFAQQPKWLNYVNTESVTCYAENEEVLWVGTKGGLFRIDKQTGQRILYQKINSDLPFNQINTMALDQNDNLWLGVDGQGPDRALVKFDGKTWISHNFTDNSGFHINIHRIVIDANDIIWIVSKGQGVIRFDGTNYEIYDVANSALPDNDVRGLAIDNNNHVWFGTWNGGLVKFDGANWEVHDVTNNIGPNGPVNGIYDLAVDSKNNIWVGSTSFLYQFDGTELKWYPVGFFPQVAYTRENYVLSIDIDSKDNLWLGTRRSGVFHFNRAPSQWTIYNTHNSPLITDKLNIVYVGNNDVAYISDMAGNTEGFQKIDDYNWTTYSTKTSDLAHNLVRSITIDDHNHKWIGTGRGVNKVNDSWTSIGNPLDYIKQIFIDTKGVKWMIPITGGLLKYDDTNWTFYHDQNSIIQDQLGYINDIIEWNNALWIATSNGGLLNFNEQQSVIFDEDNSPLPTNFIFTLEVDDKNNLWLGTRGEGLVKFDGQNWEVFNTSNSRLPHNFIHSLLYHNNKLYIGTWGAGLATFDENKWESYSTANSEIPSNKILDMTGEDNSIWIGTHIGGLAHFDGSNWQTFNTYNSELPTNFVLAVNTDKLGNLWIGTNGGVAVYNKQGIKTSYEESLFNIDIYPNPFIISSNIEVELDKDAHLKIDIYDVAGKHVDNLINAYREKGTHNVNMDASKLSGGIYLVQFAINNTVINKRAIKIQ